MSSTFFIPRSTSWQPDASRRSHGRDPTTVFAKALIVTDMGLAKAGVASMVAEKLAMQDIDSVIFDGAKPNPSIANVECGLGLLKESHCRISWCRWAVGRLTTRAKGIALCATNGGQIRDYEGVDQSSKPQPPLIIKHHRRHCQRDDPVLHHYRRIASRENVIIADRNVTPLLSVNDPALMVAMPKSLTAALPAWTP